MFNKKNIVIVLLILVMGILTLSASDNNTRRTLDISGKAEWVTGEGLTGEVKVQLFYQNTPGEDYVADIEPESRTYSITEGVTDAYDELVITCTITEGHCCTNPLFLELTHYHKLVGFLSFSQMKTSSITTRILDNHNPCTYESSKFYCSHM